MILGLLAVVGLVLVVLVAFQRLGMWCDAQTGRNLYQWQECMSPWEDGVTAIVQVSGVVLLGGAFAAIAARRFVRR